MNVNFARRVQLSILDTNVPFSMKSWADCIAGHCLHVARAEGRTVPDPAMMRPSNALYPQSDPAKNVELFAMGCLELPLEEAYALFVEFKINEDYNRQLAVERIEALIHQHSETSLRGKAHSRSPRAKPQVCTEELVTA